MKLLYVLALGGVTHAHYNFPSMIYQNAVTPAWQYVRQWTGYYTYDPVVDVTIVDIRCNVNGSTSGTGVSTLSIAAGSTLGFTAGPNIYHPGPLQVYMAAVPSTSTPSTWDGSGDVWFKIYEDGPTFGGTALTWETSYPNYATSWNFTVPAEVPSGDYLVRFEHIGLHVASSVNGAQFYISCGQVSVTGGGSGTPSPLVAFPGAYSPTDPGLLIDIYYPVPTNYTNPGPPVWPGTGSGTGTTATSAATTSTKAGTTSKTTTSAVTTSTKAVTTSVSTVATSTSSSSGCVVTIYGQCGGTGYTGCTVCDASTCSAVSPPYYSQCV